MSYKRSAPKETKLDNHHCDEAIRYTHDSFGKVTVLKVQCGPPGTVLFGSALKHQHYMVVEVERANLDRYLNRDWIHSEETIVRFAFSEAQWAQFVSSQGCGTGTPVTLERAPEIGTPIRQMDGLISEPVKKVFDREIKERTKRAVEDGKKALDQLNAMLAGKTISKTDLKAAISHLQTHVNNLPANMGYVQESFQESMEKTVQDGKIEIETFLSNLAMTTGMEVLRNQNGPTLINDVDE